MNWAPVAICWSSTLAVVSLWSAICALNAMSRATSNLIRAAYILLGVGACAVLLAPGYLNRAPSGAELLLVSGVAALALFDRRRSHLTR